MRNGDEGGVWDIIRHQEWRQNDVGTKSGCCSSLQQLCARRVGLVTRYRELGNRVMHNDVFKLRRIGLKANRTTIH